VAAVLDAPEWVDVSFDCPCRICGAVQGCTSMSDDDFARCLEQPSDWPLVTGGWLHRVDQLGER
jgi:hypothetical protein